MKLKVTFNKVMAGIAMSALTLAGCGEDDDPGARHELNVPDHYEFESRFEAGDSVFHAGQTFRHLLIAELKNRIGGLTDRLDMSTLTPTVGDVRGELDFYYRFDATTSGSLDLELSTTPPVAHQKYQDLHKGTTLSAKIAGNDAVGQHRNWDTDFIGWDVPGVTSPESLIDHWFGQLDAAAIERSNGRIPTDPDGNPVAKVFITAEGHDLQQLIQKLLLGAITYSHGADDYLDGDTPDKGLRSDNTMAEDGENFTALEHAWDEGFGYFGAAVDYLDYTDDEIAGKGGRADYEHGYHDRDGSGSIDLTSEHNFGHSVNAAKRDRGSADAAKTDYTDKAMRAFLAGRALISHAGGALSAEQVTELARHRDTAVDAWERAIAATTLHYINDLIGDMAKYGTADYSFADYAKHWSELKGFALSLQFNPRAHLTRAQQVALHEAIGTAPAAPADGAAYKTKLLEARRILADGYSFDAANVGDDNGEGGW